MSYSLKCKATTFGICFASIVVAIILFFCLPSTCYASQLGSDEPYVYFTYEKDGTEVDGNELLNNETYDVNIWISNIETVSVLEITATYDDSVTVASTPLSLMSDTVSGISSMGYVIGSGNLVFGFVSDNDSYTAIDSNGTLVAKISATFSEAGDAQDFITVSANPNLTFVQASYDDGYDDSYALDVDFAGYNGVLYSMTCDVSPSFTTGNYDITGQIKIASDTTGTNTLNGIVGITVSVVDNGETIAQAVTDKNGIYTLSGIPEGTYKMIISGSTTIDREVTLVVTESKTVDSVGVILCDYNKDTLVNTTDFSLFLKKYDSDSDYDVYYDFNSDGLVNTTDFSIFLAFYDKEIVYADVILD
jgi:hypothetical protein